MDTSCIYKITCISTGRFYIGSACRFKIRRKDHLWALRNNKHGNQKLQRAYNKYGPDNFIFEVVEPVEKREDLIQREQHYIDSLRPFFNICIVAGSVLGKKVSEETKLKISRGNKGKRFPEEWKKNFSLARLGKSVSPEIRKKISNAQMGAKRGPYKPWSEERRAKMMLIYGSEEYKKKISGKTKSEENIKKLSQALKGKPWSNKRRKASHVNKIEIKNGLV